MKKLPPKWADQFLEWYCRADKLEEIQGDVHELFQRRSKSSIAKANFLFMWDVLRFFRRKNIKAQTKSASSLTSVPMIKNIFVVAFRNFKRQLGSSILNLTGLAAGFTCCILIGLWVLQELSFDQQADKGTKIVRVLSHMQSEGSTQTYDIASASIDVSSVPEVQSMTSVSTGTRWPHELCFNADFGTTGSLAGPNQDPAAKGSCIYLKGVYSTESFFKVFNYQVTQGNPAPAMEGGQIAISERMAMTLFGKVDAVGKVLKIDGRHDVTVVTVFQTIPVTSSLQFDFVMPFGILKKLWGASDQQLASNFFNIYLKTDASVNVNELTAKLNDDRVLPKNLKSEKISYEAFPLTDWHLYSKFEGGKNTGGRIEYVRIFVGIALLVLIMAVINFINMTTARASTRAKEIGIRKVTGAFRSGIIAQFMTESFITVLAAFLLALGLTQLALPRFNALLPEPVVLTFYHGMMPFYLLGFLCVIAFIAGAYPSFILSSFQPVTILKDRFAGTMTGSNRLRKSLLIVQLSVSLGIIMFSGVLYWQLHYIGTKELGFDRQNMVRLEPTYRLLQKIDVFKNELAKGKEILHVTAANGNPLDVGGANTTISWPGKNPSTRTAFSTIGCTYEFAETFGLKILDGRDFLPKAQDTINNEVLVTQEAAKTMQLKNPVGEHITVDNEPCVIIGVVNDFHTGSLREARLPVILQRISIFYTGGLYLKYRSGQTAAAMRELERAYTAIEPTYTMKCSFQDETFNALYKTEQTASKLTVLFTVVTLIIAFIGVLGLATFNVIRKTREIGIRRVYGASSSQILTLLTKEFSAVMYIAILIATPLTWYLSANWLKGFAYSIAIPWWWFGISFSGIALLTVAIICFQALRTIAGNPTDVLRSE